MTGVAAATETVATGPPRRFELAAWREQYGVVAGVTARDGGFNLGLWTGEPAGAVMDRWTTLRLAAPGFPGMLLLRQVHGARVVQIERPIEGLLLHSEADGAISRQQGVLLAVTVADCVPIYLAVPNRGIVGLLHAGWRGIAGGIVECAITRLGALGLDGRDIVMHCGVSICGSCYEVGHEVAQMVAGRPVVEGKHRLDLRRAAAERAQRAGVVHTTFSPYCTVEQSNDFFSHRQSGGSDGRMAAYIGIPAHVGVG